MRRATRKFMGLLIILLAMCAGLIATGSEQVSEELREIENWANRQNGSIDAGELVDLINGDNTDRSGGTTFGPEFTFTTSDTEYMSACKIDANRFLVSYRSGFSSYSIIGTISNNSITFGSQTAFLAGIVSRSSTEMLDAERFIVAYSIDYTGARYGRTIIGTISSGNVITFGTAYEFQTGNTLYWLELNVFDANTFMVSYRNDGNSSHGTACVGSITDGVISYGTEVIFNAANSIYLSAFTLDATNCILAYSDDGTAGNAVIATISGTDVSFGSEFTFQTGRVANLQIVGLSATTFAVAYEYNYQGNFIIGTITGSSLSFGSAYVFETNRPKVQSMCKLDSDNFVVAYKMNTGTYQGFALECMVSGDVLTFNQPIVFNNSSNAEGLLIGLSATDYAIAYGGSNYGSGEAKLGTKVVLPDTPSILNNGISGISATDATLASYLLWEGNPTATVRGACWSTSPSPTVSDATSQDGSGYGEYSSSLTGLTASTTYYARAYATNSVGSGYGEEVSFTTLSPAVIWNSANIDFAKGSGVDWTLEENQDRITNNVWITRKDQGPVFNIFTYSGHSSSNNDIEWAYGTTANYSTLTYYTDIKDLTDSSMPSIVDKDVVLHLLVDNIYLDMVFSSWGSDDGGTFSYTRASEAGASGQAGTGDASGTPADADPLEVPVEPMDSHDYGDGGGAVVVDPDVTVNPNEDGATITVDSF